jgi:branched-chain amino acid transport system substrate-binding protein
MRGFAAAAAVLALAVLGGCGGGDSKPTGPQRLNLEIGNLLPLTGYFDPFGKPTERAANVAAEEIRKAAAKAGARHTVQMHNIDYESDPKKAIDLGNALARNGSTCLTGPFGSGHAARVGANVATPKKMLQITPSASAVQISQVEDRGYLNRLVPPDRIQADALAEHISRTLKGGAKGKTVNIGFPEVTYAKSLTKRFEEVWKAKGGTIGRKVTYKPDSTIFTAQAQQLLEGKPDAWVFFDFVDSYVKIALEMAKDEDGGWSSRKTFGTDSLATPRLPGTGPTVTNGLSGVAISAPEQGKAQQAFDAAFRRVGQVNRQTFDAQEFDAVILCYLAAVAAGSTDGSDMKDELRAITAAPGRKYTWQELDEAIRALESGQDINYEGVSGPIELNDKGDATAGVYDIYKVRNGKLDVVDQIAIPLRAGGV